MNEFSEIEIAGLKLRPWTFRQVQQAAEPLERLFKKMDDCGIDLGDFTEQASLAKLGRFVFAALPEISKVLQISTGAPADKISDMEISEVVALAKAIVLLNSSILKNSETQPATPEPGELGS